MDKVDTDNFDLSAQSFLSKMFPLRFIYESIFKIIFFTVSDLSRKQLKNNTRICKELLRLADVLEPGITRFRGLLIFYLVRGLIRLNRIKNKRVSTAFMTEFKY